MITGRDAMRFVNYIFTNDVASANDMKMIYGLLLYPSGGVVDDMMAYKYNDEKCLLVVNASNTDKDYEWIMRHIDGFDVEVLNLSNQYSQLALQGPKSCNVLQKITSYNLETLKLFEFNEFEILGMKFMVSRSGYTGEDGFEIYGSNEDILTLEKYFVEEDKIGLCGLGCRDTLRFEAAMPLYGHEISEDINPLIFGLNYGISFSKDFIGKEELLKQKENGLKKRIVGLELLERGIARGGYEVEKDGNIIGVITTGYMIPNTNKCYAFAMIDTEYAKLGTLVNVKIRKNIVLAKVRNKKFLEKKYVR